MSYVFISYARDDDEAFVKRLYADLTARGIRVWWDRKAMESRGLTFLQEIRDAIALVDQVMLVVGPAAVKSEYVRGEWEFALELCKVVVPLLRLGAEGAIPSVVRKEDFAIVPPELSTFHAPDFRSDAAYSTALDELTRILVTPVAPLASTSGVDLLPPHYLTRPSVARHLAEAVLSDLLKPAVMTATHQTVTLVGMGGVGKSVIAAAFARECQTRRAFPDGLVWLRVGQTASGADQEATAVRFLAAIASALDQPSVAFGDSAAAQKGVSAILANRRCLIVLDDIWEAGPAAVVASVLGPRCRLLATTRDASISTMLDAAQCPVDLLDEPEALALLAEWVNLAVEGLPPLALDIVRECGCLALAVAILGAMLRGRPADRWADALDRLRRADLEKIRREFPTYPYPDLLRSIGVSVEALSESDREKYLALAVFSQGSVIPEAALEVLFYAGHGSRADVHDFVDRIVDRSMARRLEDAIVLHDLQHDYIVRQAADPRSLHRRLVEAYRGFAANGWPSGPRDGYFFQRLPWHLKQAGLDEELNALLATPEWLESKLIATDANAVIADAVLAPTSPVAGIISEATRLSDPAIALEPSELRAQLLGRLPMGFNAQLDQFRSRLCDGGPRPLMALRRPTLSTAGGPLIRTIRAHDMSVEDLVVAPAFDLAATAALEVDEDYSHNGRVRIWEVATGRQRHVIDAHPDNIHALVVARDGRSFWSMGQDRSLRLWEFESGSLLRTISLDDNIDKMYLLPGRNRGLCQAGQKLRLLDLDTGAFASDYLIVEVRIGGCVVVDDDSVVVMNWLGDIRLVEIGGWRTRWVSKGHAKYGVEMAVDRASRRLYSAEQGNHVSIVDLETGATIGISAGTLGDYPTTALATHGDVLLVGMNDGLFQARDLSGRRPPVSHSEHENRVTGIRIKHDGRSALSLSADGTLKLWDLARLDLKGVERAHALHVSQVAIAEDCRTGVSVSGDGTIAIWDLSIGVVRHRGVTKEWMSDVVILPDGLRAVTSHSGAILRIWDLRTAAMLQARENQRDETYQALTLVGGGRQLIASWQVDAEQEQLYGLSVWNLEPLEPVGFHMDESDAPSLHGYRLAWADQSEIGLSPTTMGVALWRLEDVGPKQVGTIGAGHTSHVIAVPGTPRIVVASDDWVQLWNVSSGAMEARVAFNGVTRIAVIPPFVLAGGSGGHVALLDLVTLARRTSLRLDAGVASCALSRDARTAMVGDVNGQVHVIAIVV